MNYIQALEDTGERDETVIDQVAALALIPSIHSKVLKLYAKSRNTKKFIELMDQWVLRFPNLFIQNPYVKSYIEANPQLMEKYSNLLSRQ
jgi:hypothetical protein